MTNGSFKQQRNLPTKLLATLLVIVTALAAAGSPASAKGSVKDEVGVGFFYGTFEKDPNIVLIVGGAAEDFCEANPMDPFNGEPGSATAHVSTDKDGSTKVRVNSRNQPIYLYKTNIEGAPPWIEDACAAYFTDGTRPEPFATGSARLKVRDYIESQNYVEVFNSVKGKATGIDGARYKVSASADLVVENGVPIGNPEDFVSFNLKKISR